MKPFTPRVIFLVAALVFLVLLAGLLAAAPKHPVARFRVVDAVGNPIAGAVIRPEGLRTKPGRYQSGWYGWSPERTGVPNPPVKTSSDGYANVPYPKYVFERLETGKLCLAVEHPDYVPDRAERIVATTPPKGAPLREWLDYVLSRIRLKVLVARGDPIVLQPGAILKVTARPGSSQSSEARLFAQVSGQPGVDSDSWITIARGVILCRQLAAGSHTLRAVRVDPKGGAWFSDLEDVTVRPGVTNELVVDLKPGATVRGQLENQVPRPVKSGRVVAHVWPKKGNPQSSPPEWHSWAAVKADGTFEIESLPEGDLEIVALCAGYVSTNGPGQFGMRYPQKHLLGTNDLAIVIGMEPTACLEAKVVDDKGQALKGVRVVAWPNVRYGEWAATILASDCYRASDRLLNGRPKEALAWQEVPDFQGVSDANGIALLSNLPATVREVAVNDEWFALRPVKDSMGGQHRQASVTLTAGRTNHVSLQVEPREKSLIRHF